MGVSSLLPQVTLLADASQVGRTMKEVVSPLVLTLSGLASLVCVLVLIIGGIHYMSASSNPERLEHAKKLLRNAVLGLIIILAAATLTSFLTHAYNAGGGNPTSQFPQIAEIKPKDTSPGLVDVLIKAITGLLQNVVESVAKPFIDALTFFTSSTPLMAENRSVFNLWLGMVGMADALFILVVVMLGFNLMSASVFGLDEVEFKHLLPQLGLTFVLINSSIFLIDAVIGLSNGMIRALTAGFGNITVWDALGNVTKEASGLGVATLLIMIAFVVLSVILLVYYVGRLVTLYLGAILAPLVFLIWLLPSFKDFATNVMKTYLTTIFVLFIHVVILMLAASIFASLNAATPNQPPNALLALVVGIATLVALLKTQGVLTQLTYASIGPKAMRKLGNQFVNSVSHVTNTTKKVVAKAPTPQKGTS